MEVISTKIPDPTFEPGAPINKDVTLGKDVFTAQTVDKETLQNTKFNVSEDGTITPAVQANQADNKKKLLLIGGAALLLLLLLKK